MRNVVVFPKRSLLVGCVGLFQVLAQDVDPVLVGQWPAVEEVWDGVALAVTVADRYAYVATAWDGLEIVDIADPRQPRKVGRLAEYGYAEVAVQGRYLFVADGRPQSGPPGTHGKGLVIVDMTDPSSPREIASYPTAGDINGVAVAGDYAYVTEVTRDYVFPTEPGEGLTVLDISDPANPRRVGGHPSISSPLTVSGGFGYVPAYSAGLRVLDLSDPTNPREVGSYLEEGASIGAVAVAGPLACVTIAPVDSVARLAVLDVSDPANPRKLGEYKVTNYLGHRIAVSGNRVLVADDSHGLLVIDIADPAHPRRIGGYDGRFFGVAAIGTLAWVADDDACLLALETGKPAVLRQVGGYPTTGRTYQVRVADARAYVLDRTAGFEILDLSNLAEPERLGAYSTSPYRVNDVAVAGGHAFLASGGASIGNQWLNGEGVVVLDVSNPAHPDRVGSYPDLGAAWRLAVQGGYAYVLDSPDPPGVPDVVPAQGLVVIDVTEPAAPRRIASYGEGTWISDLTLVGTRAYVVGDTLDIVEVATPSNPVRLGRYQAERTGGICLAVQEPYAYVGWNKAVEVFEVGDPANPRPIGRLEVNGLPARIAVADGYALVANTGGADGGAGLWLLDISDPVRPRRVGGYSSLASLDVALVERRALVPAGRLGLAVLEPLPVFHSITAGVEGVTLRWEGLENLRLQRATLGGDTAWEDVGVAAGERRVTLPPDGGRGIFRLVTP
jgi:hypothetical protein